MPMSAADRKFLDDLGTRLGRAAAKKVRPRVREASRTLARAIQVQRTSLRKTHVYIPHYWSLMVHDGRRPFRKQRFMVWFRNPRNDPRLPGGKTPQRVSQLRHMSREEFEFWQEQNRKADPTGLNPRARPMVVTKVIRKPTPPDRFFANDDGMLGFQQEAADIIKNEFSLHVLRTVQETQSRGASLREVTDKAVGRI